MNTMIETDIAQRWADRDITKKEAKTLCKKRGVSWHNILKFNRQAV